MMEVTPIKLENLISEAVQIGRREVVEWILAQDDDGRQMDRAQFGWLWVDSEEWPKKLKEWGIEKT